MKEKVIPAQVQPIVRQRFYLPKGQKLDKKQKAYLNSGHVWETDKQGFIHIFAGKVHQDPHNGPRCKKCGYNPCWHCEPVPKKCV